VFFLMVGETASNSPLADVGGLSDLLQHTHTGSPGLSADTEVLGKRAAEEDSPLFAKLGRTVFQFKDAIAGGGHLSPTPEDPTEVQQKGAHSLSFSHKSVSPLPSFQNKDSSIIKS